MRHADIQRILDAAAAQQAVAIVKSLDGSGQVFYTDQELKSENELERAIAESFRKDRSRIVDINSERYFIHIFNPRPNLIIVGAVHIARHLIPLADMCGYDVVLIDPRRAFTESRFPAPINVVVEWPDKAYFRFERGSRTAVVTLTHDPKVDEPALLAAFQSEAFYIGALGSRRTHAARCERLIQTGASSQDIARIHAPIGLDIGAQSPAEIAVAIMGEITNSLRQVPD